MRNIKLTIREFDSLIIKKSIAGLVIPAFFMSTFLFLGMVFFVIMCYNKGWEGCI